MQVSDFGDREIAAHHLASDLVQAWGLDNHEWGASLTRVIEEYRIRSSILSVNMDTFCFEWVGPTLTFLDDDPVRLYNGPLMALRDQAFARGIVANLKRATAGVRPYLCRIDTPLNGLDVSYDMLSLPICNPRSGTIVSCIRAPLTLTVKAPPPVDFDPARCPLKTIFRED